MIILPIFAQYSLASLKASRCASEAPALGDAAAEVMYVSGPNLKTPLDWEHATKRARAKLNITRMVARLFTADLGVSNFPRCGRILFADRFQCKGVVGYVGQIARL